MARTAGELLEACREHGPSVVLMETDVTDWDPLRLVAALRRMLPEAVVTGLTASRSRKR